MAITELKRFPDGEGYVRIHDDLAGQEVVIVQNSYPDPNLVELLLLQDAVMEYKPARVITVVPYFGYARQDKKFNQGEPISARALTRHMTRFTTELITIDLHETSILEWSDSPARNISGMPAIARALKEYAPDFILSPDKGAVDLATIVADHLGCGWDYLEKTRLDGETVVMKAKKVDVAGKKVAIVDDIIATGGTIIRATEQLRDQGATYVMAACTHGLFTGGAIERLNPVLDGLFSTDTLMNSTSKVSVAVELADALQQKN